MESLHILLGRFFIFLQDKVSLTETGGGLYLEFAHEYKVKQSKNGKFPSHCKLAQSVLKSKFPSVYKTLKKGL